MKLKILLSVALIGGVITMGLIGFFRHKKTNTIIYRLVWFELQITPDTYRFAILPEQPILIGLEDGAGDKGATMLIRYEHVPEVYEKIVEKVDSILRKHKVLSLAPQDPERAFKDEYMEKPRIHIRVSYADNTQWASVYYLDKMPTEIEALIQDTKALARQVLQEQSKESIDGDTAKAYLKPESNTAQQDSPRIIIKIKVYNSGKIAMNQKEVSLTELASALDDLQNKKGAVWYYRESPDKEPSESVIKTIKAVLDTVASRNLPIHLQTEDY